MKGCRSLTDEEITNVFNTLSCKRDKMLWILGLRSGLRISELLSLKIGNVWQHDDIAKQVTVDKKNTKGKLESKTLPLAESARIVIKEYLLSLESINPKDPLFKSSQSEKAITRIRAHKMLKKAFNQLKMQGKLSTHVMRKTFAHKVHKALGEKIEKTQLAMGHKSLSSTVSYIQINREEVEKAILGLG